MILVLSGTGDGRLIVRNLAEKGYSVLATSVTSYGGKLLADSSSVEVLARPLDREELMDLAAERNIEVIIDATHPYAEQISKLAIEICEKKDIPYIRYERPEMQLPEHPLLLHTDNYHQAAKKAASVGKTIFLTTGSKTLDIFIEAAREKERRVVARVLPHPDILKRCLDLGLTPADVVAMQGPFTKELNLEMLKQCKAEVMVTKNSGPVGGLDTKIDAALKLQIPVVIVDRPKYLTSSEPARTLTDLYQELEKLQIN